MLIDESKLPPVLPLRVEFQAAETQFLPAFLGSALHGALGRALWKSVCVFPRRRECAGCPLINRCAYPALFGTVVPVTEGLQRLGIRDQAPRPLVLSPEDGWTRPSGHPRPINEGAIIPFRVTLIGRAIEDLPIVVVALRKAAETGIGRVATHMAEGPKAPHAPALLARITSEDGSDLIFDAADQQLRACSPKRVTVPRPGTGPVSIRFITPLRLKLDGKVCGRPGPADLALALAWRTNALATLYGASEQPADDAAIKRAAEQIEVEESTTRLVHVRRYSARQRQKMDLPGVLGHFRWRGGSPLDELWPLLLFGEVVQVGKGTALGFGRYVIAN
jgi:hypothetical protein